MQDCYFAPSFSSRGFSIVRRKQDSFGVVRRNVGDGLGNGQSACAEWVELDSGTARRGAARTVIPVHCEGHGAATAQSAHCRLVAFKSYALLLAAVHPPTASAARTGGKSERRCTDPPTGGVPYVGLMSPVDVPLSAITRRLRVLSLLLRTNLLSVLTC